MSLEDNKKKEKKEKKERKRKLTATEELHEEGSTKRDSIDEDQGGKEKRKLRRLERKKLLKDVPKVDENGISFTKLQLRRMAKRIAKGLDPIESEAEKQERLQNEAQMRRQEQDELDGIIRKPNEGAADDDDDDDDDQQADHHDRDSDDEKDSVQLYSDATHSNNNEHDGEETTDDVAVDKKEAKHAAGESPRKKKRRVKPVPEDYVCSACKNRHKPLHWIYDCPDKVTMRGTNQVAKDLRGLHDPSAQKVFVSGLPFSITIQHLKKAFEQSCGPVSRTKLLTFEDSGRCKGQAIITFKEVQGAQKALATMDGKALNIESDEKKSAGKQLKLKVAKVLNRKASKDSSQKF